MTKPSTLCLIHDEINNRVLLGMKKRGFGAGRWNGFGGKLLPDESIKQAAKREMLEECGITAEEITEVGLLNFTFQEQIDKNPEGYDTLEVHIFRMEEWKGEPVEGEEMKPQWFDINEIPFVDMWPDDKYWMPHFFNGKKFTGSFLFGPQDSILKYKLDLLD